jgi:hypothetical protein
MTIKKLTPAEAETHALVHSWRTMKQSVHPADWAKAHPPKPETEDAKPEMTGTAKAGQPTIRITPATEDITDADDQPRSDTFKPESS